MNQDFNHKPRPAGQPVGPPRPAQPLAPRPFQPVPTQPQPLSTTPTPDLTPVAPPVSQPIQPNTAGLKVKKSSKGKKIALFTLLGLFIIILGLAAAGYSWYQSQLSPVGSNKDELVKVTIPKDSAPSTIGQILKEKNVIRSEEAFALYTRISKTQNSLQAGAYRISPSESTPEIVEHLTSGRVDTFDITFLPGSTLAQNRQVLIKAGFSESEVDAGLSASYDSPLFDGKPASADLEGYIYGETYKFGSDATVKEILAHTFEIYNEFVSENDLVAKFKAQDLTLYQGIILASIVQRESIGGDEPEIASVFYNRLANGTELGSDVTYQYIADKTGVARDVNLDSPYNTRRYTGLPPGPIAAPGKNALLAVANPAQTDYLFFLSGDDDVTYYGTTLAEHEENIKAHCQQKCSIL